MSTHVLLCYRQDSCPLAGFELALLFLQTFLFFLHEMLFPMVYGLKCPSGGHFDIDWCIDIGLMIEEVWTNLTVPHHQLVCGQGS